MFETFGYDPVGNMTTHTDFRSKITTLAYDGRDRLLSKSPDPSLGEQARSYLYFPTGTRQSMTDPSGTTTYLYDSRNRLVTKTAPAGTLTYSYDDAGNLATIDSANPNGTSVSYLWDAANQLATITDNRTGGVTNALYTPTRRPSTLSQPNGVGVTYSYDSLDRILSMSWKQGTSPEFGSWAYTYNDRSQRLSSTDVTGRNAAYSYDDDARLTSETIAGDPRGAGFNGVLSYLLDGTGNRLSRTSTLGALPAQSFTYNANDELDSDTYDPNGNTMVANGHTYAYDFENRLLSKDNGGVIVVYDCDGNRVAKTVGGVTTQYLVDDLNPTGYPQVVEEVSGGAVQARYTYGNVIVSQTRNAASIPATTYYGYDGHGSITFLSDATGAVTDTYDYDGWGSLLATSGETHNTRGYAGEEVDQDLGLVLLRKRQYDSARGRFFQIDPVAGNIVLPVSLNRYLYAHAEPVDLKDPWGLAVPNARAGGDEYSELASAIGGTILTGYLVVGLGRGGTYTTLNAQGSLGGAGWQVACQFASATERTSDTVISPLKDCQQKNGDDGDPPCDHVEGDRPDLCEYDCHDGSGNLWSIPYVNPCPESLTKQQIMDGYSYGYR
jgi:RHS repeat-associated protein